MQLEEFLEQSARLHPRKTAIVCGEQRIGYADLEVDANRLAHALIDRGLKCGDRVLIWLDNSIEAVTAVFAVLKAGGVFVMVNPTTKPHKLAYLLENAGAQMLFAPARRSAAVGQLRTATGQPQQVILVGEAPAAPSDRRTVSYTRLLQEFAACSLPPAKRAIDIDLAALIYTSGSTGHPKGVMLTHLNMVSAATSITTYLENREDDIILNVLPLSFDYGLYQVLMAFRFGGTVVLEKSFTYPHAVLSTLEKERVTGFPLVPTMAAILLELDLSRYDTSSLRYVTNTGAALPTEHIRRLRQVWPHVRIYSMYGLTECKRVAYLPPEEIDRRPDSVGRAMPNTQVFIVDEQGQRVPPGEVGELVVRGANVMKGYWKSPQATADRLKPGPLPGEFVLYTGDLFRMDEEGFLYFVGRRDDIIKSRGEKVSPREVEDVLCRHPDVTQAAVVGVPEAVLGQAIHAFVTLAENAAADERELLRWCRRELEDYMVPQRIEIRDTLPRTPSGKVDKKQLAGAGT